MSFIDKLKELFSREKEGKELTEEERRKKLMGRIILIAVLIFGVLVFFFTLSTPKKPKKRIVKVGGKKSQFAVPTEEIDIYKKKWIEESAAKLDSIMAVLNNLKKELEGTKSELQSKIDALSKKQKELENDFYNVVEKLPINAPYFPKGSRKSTRRTTTTQATTQAPQTEYVPPIKQHVYMGESGIKVISPINEKDGNTTSKKNTAVNTSNTGSSENISLSSTSTSEFTIPAGSFAKATLLSGVDAPTAGDAHPVVIEITDPFIMASLKRGNLENAFIVGAAYGDLSSERVFIRLEKLSFFIGDKPYELPVKGWVVDYRDGMYGIKGKVVDKQGRLIAFALLSGIAGGVSQAIAVSGYEQQITPMGGQVYTLKPEQVYKVAAATGARSAATMLADFYLKKAEKLFPVVQVKAGTPVYVVFQEGVSFNFEGGKFYEGEEFNY